MKRTALAVSGLALSAFFISAPAMAQDHVDANGMPTTHSTPEERAQTADLNTQVSQSNAEIAAQDNNNKAKYAIQEQQYQDQLQQNHQAQQDYQQAQQDYQQKSADYANQTARYESLRARYAAERAAYHRGEWPDRYSRLTIDQFTADLIGQRVEILNGDHIGTVQDVARYSDGRVEALLVKLDSDKVVWIDRADIRYDRADGIVMTNLDRTDLHQMADERL